MSGEHHESDEGDWRGDPDSGSRTLDELSSEEILRALRGLDELLKADAEDTYSLLARGMLHSKRETTAGRRRTSAGSSSWSRTTPKPCKTGQRPATTWESSAWPGKIMTPSSGSNRTTP